MLKEAAFKDIFPRVQRPLFLPVKQDHNIICEYNIQFKTGFVDHKIYYQEMEWFNTEF